MHRRPLAVALAVAGFGAPAGAQSFVTGVSMNVPMFWVNNRTNTQSPLFPGDSATFWFDVSFTNQFNVATFSPAIGTFTSGTVLGIGSGFFDLVGLGGTQGTWQLGNNPTPQTNNGTTGIGVRSGWRIVGNASPGSVNAAGTGINQIQFGQFPAAPELANTTNPVRRMFAVIWTPASYTVRSMTFQLVPSAAAGSAVAGVYLDLNGSVGASAFVTANNLVLGSVTIPIPAPSALALLGLGSLLAARRRR